MLHLPGWLYKGEHKQVVSNLVFFVSSLPGWLYKGEHKQVVSNLGLLCPIYQDGYIRVNISKL